MFEDAARAKMLAAWTIGRRSGHYVGPRGRNVIINKSFGGPTVTKDGVTVSRKSSSKTRSRTWGAKLVHESGDKTSSLAGDGTTTANCARSRDPSRRHSQHRAGSNPTAVRRGIEKAVSAATEQLDKMAKKVTSSRKLPTLARSAQITTK